MARIEQQLVYEKVREVYQFMINGSKQRKDIIQFFVEKWTNEKFFGDGIKEISKHRTVDNYIRKVKQSFLNFENEVETEKGRTLARLDDLYAKSIKIQDYKGALAVLKEISEIVGIKITNINHKVDAPKGIEITVKRVESKD